MLDDGKARRYNLKDYRTQLAIHMARLKHDDDVTSKRIASQSIRRFLGFSPCCDSGRRRWKGNHSECVL